MDKQQLLKLSQIENKDLVEVKEPESIRELTAEEIESVSGADSCWFVPGSTVGCWAY